LGRSAKPGNVLYSTEQLLAKGVSIFEVERGGDVTFHGPGQMVLYPIINLASRHRDVGWYMRTLEQIVVDALQPLGITGLQVPGRTGVWTHGAETDIQINGLGRDTGTPNAKIASIGVRISRWCTMHGLALNVADNREGFALINPCGFCDIQVTSVEQEIGRVVQPGEMLTIRDSLVRCFIATFCQSSPISLS